MSNHQLLEALNWRYATKAFDPAKKIPADTWQALQQALILTPTSYGLQPYRFLVITDPATRAALLPHSWGQKQVVDCSHFVVFTAKTKMTEADVDKLIRRTVEIRKLPAPEALGTYRFMMLGCGERPARQNRARMGDAPDLHRARQFDDLRRRSWRGRLPNGGSGPNRIRQSFEFERQRLRDGRCLCARLSFT